MSVTINGENNMNELDTILERQGEILEEIKEKSDIPTWKIELALAEFLTLQLSYNIELYKQSKGYK